MHILVVDDEAMVCAMVEMILEDAGYEVTTTNSAEDALALLAEGGEFDLVISDLNMPGLDGIELFAKLKLLDCPWPFVLLSGDDPQKLRTRAPGINDFLAKDDSLEETLPRAAAQLLARSGDRKLDQ